MKSDDESPVRLPSLAVFLVPVVCLMVFLGAAVIKHYVLTKLAF